MTTCGDSGGVTKAGAPCANFLNLSATNGLCLAHDPERAAEKKEASANGGRAGAETKRGAMVARPSEVPAAPKTLEDAVEFASWLSRAVCIGTLDARTAHEATYSLACFKAGAEKRDLQRSLKEQQKVLDKIQKCPACAARWAEVRGPNH